MARSKKQSALRYPMTTVLGSDANVRILREFALHGGEIAAPSLVASTGLAPSSVHSSISLLERMGIVETIGSSRSRVSRLVVGRSGYPRSLTSAIVDMFKEEKSRYELLIDRLAVMAGSGRDSVVAAWLYGSVARGEDGPDSDIDVAVILREEADLVRTEDLMFGMKNVVEEEFVVEISIVMVTMDDVLRLDEENDPWWTDLCRDAKRLVGKRPEELLSAIRREKRLRDSGIKI